MLSADKIWISKLQDGGRPPFWYIEKSPYLRNGLTIAAKFCTMTHTDSLNCTRSLKKIDYLKYKMANGHHFAQNVKSL